jgi:hypothetical protein
MCILHVVPQRGKKNKNPPLRRRVIAGLYVIPMSPPLKPVDIAADVAPLMCASLLPVLCITGERPAPEGSASACDINLYISVVIMFNWRPG